MRDYPLGEATTKELTHSRFPCGQCGAVLKYNIGTTDLSCGYCGHQNLIVNSADPILEYDIHQALRELARVQKLAKPSSILYCTTCAAEFDLERHIHSGECPYCGTTVVTGTGHVKSIKPKALLPFSVTADEARESYRKWLSGLWFAPSALKKYTREDTHLNGVYIPYWTYDSKTRTAYRGMRGDVYYVKQSYTATVNGRRVRQTRMVPKIRWSPVNGRTRRHFDDVLVGASRSLPRKIMDWLQPWDLENLIPYTEAYLSGFQSEIYQIELDDGFNHAKKVMDDTIHGDVRRDIGGDQQRITSLNTSHSDTTFKHVLLPLWSAAFTFRGKPYRFVVNGRNGKTRGERPWSVVKIAFAVLLGAIAVVGFMLVAGGSGAFEQLSIPVQRYQF